METREAGAKGRLTFWMQCQRERQCRELRWKGKRLRDRVLATISEELGPPVSSGGVELEVPALILRCWGKAERPARQERPGGERRPVCLASTLSRSGGGFWILWWLRVGPREQQRVLYSPNIRRLQRYRVRGLSDSCRWPSLVLFLAASTPQPWLARGAPSF
jgi:hypothetical protein